MDFFLRYRGQLPSTSARNKRVREKHEIRLYLHSQLADLWKIDPRLSGFRPETFQIGVLKRNQVEVPRPIQGEEKFFYQIPLAGYRFIPLITRPHELLCHLQIYFLRPEDPGAIVRAGGDLDNRLKTLFDALRMPHSVKEIPGPPSKTDQVFFCLLEDDALITKVSVETGRLLGPTEGSQPESDVELLIHVLVKIGYPMIANLAWQS